MEIEVMVVEVMVVEVMVEVVGLEKLDKAGILQSSPEHCFQGAELKVEH